MVEKQFCFEIKEVGVNIDIEHSVYNLLYLVELFSEFYPEKFNNKRKDEHKTVKNPKEMLLLIL